METKRLTIRKFSPDDHKDLHGYLSRKSVVKYEPYDVFTEEACKLEAERRSADARFFAVCLKETGKLIGNIYFAEKEYGAWELGYVFNENYWGAGYASEAAGTVISGAFGDRGARRIIAVCNPLNCPSWRLLERLGFRREGHLRQNIWFKKDGAGQPIWQDTYEYGILAEEWNKRKRANQ